jgi:signal transduction histidine kinase
MEPVETEALVRELGEMLENDLKTRGISLAIDGRLPVILGERARLRQVFQNLIDNAIKYMGDGAVREIHVGCDVRAGEAEFYVRDSGIGIPAEDVGKVFHVFRRGKSDAVQAVPGKGVGLSSVKSIVETYGGAIRVESESGQGSSFVFTINGQYVAHPRS